MRDSRMKAAVLAAAVALAALLPVSASAASPTGAPVAATANAPKPAKRPVCTDKDARADCVLKAVPTKVVKKAGTTEMPTNALNAAQLQDAYKLPSDLLGGGRTIAVVSPFGNSLAEEDLNAYRTANGLHPCDAEFPCLRKIDQRGGTTPPPAVPGWGLYGAVGLDMASAACPNCKLLLVEADDDTLANQGEAVDEAVRQGADAVVVMQSWTGEYEGQQALAKHFDHPGVAIVASSGSSGFNGTGQQALPAAYPTVVAVAGTELFRDPATPRGWSERVWRHTSSGCSVYAARPSWQAKGSCGNRRTVADVAAVASDLTPVLVYDTSSSGWVRVSGPPVASALISGVYGLAGNTARTKAPSRPYSSPQRHLFDITTGTNGYCGDGYLCTAGRRYDAPSGMGAPNGTGAF
ncbi:S8 family serine peptidase [Actinomadura hibisca]|uniref:S8 family serine peptidase n=1 Tax=Actinomadura hibisca TaxID=68565 RepID=UPI000ABE1875|nr:S8 family serine peptidase [Actinomadura hibisca]